MNTHTLKHAVATALLLVVLAVPILGLRLRTVGVGLEVQGADARTWWLIGGAAVLVFLWQMLRDRLPIPAWLRAGAWRTAAATGGGAIGG